MKTYQITDTSAATHAPAHYCLTHKPTKACFIGYTDDIRARLATWRSFIRRPHTLLQATFRRFLQADTQRCNLDDWQVTEFAEHEADQLPLPLVSLTAPAGRPRSLHGLRGPTPRSCLSIMLGRTTGPLPYMQDCLDNWPPDEGFHFSLKINALEGFANANGFPICLLQAMELDRCRSPGTGTIAELYEWWVEYGKHRTYLTQHGWTAVPRDMFDVFLVPLPQPDCALVPFIGPASHRERGFRKPK